MVYRLGNVTLLTYIPYRNGQSVEHQKQEEQKGMPSKKTVFATEQERIDAEKKVQEKRASDVDTANKYPARFVRTLGSNALLDIMVTENDNCPFFVADKKRRICNLNGDYLLPLVPDDTRDRNTLHENSFELTSEFLTEEVIGKLGSDLKAALVELGKEQHLEMESGAPHMAAGEGYTRQRPVISKPEAGSAAIAAVYNPEDVILRYFPSLMCGEKNAQFDGDIDVLYKTLLFGCGTDPLPERGSPEAIEFWKQNVEKKLFISGGEKIDMHATGSLPKSRSTGSEVDTYAIFYTVCMPGVKHTVDHFTCQGKRMLQQADARLVNVWIDLTEKLLGEEHVPLAATKYAASKMTKFEEVVLAPLAESACKDTWQSLREQEEESTNEKGAFIWKLTIETATGVVNGWKGKEFCNPSIDILSADGTKKSQLIFNSSEADKAMLGEMFTRADYRDAEEYTAASFHKNLAKMSKVFKALSYVFAGKEPPVTAVVLHDSEEAEKATKRGRKRKAVAPAVAEASASNGCSSSQFDSFEAFMVEQRLFNEKLLRRMTEQEAFEAEQWKQLTHAKKLRKFLYANVPVLPEEEDEEA